MNNHSERKRVLSFSFLFFYLFFILIGGSLLYNIVVGFAIHSHESAMGVHALHSGHINLHSHPKIINPKMHLSCNCYK